MTSLAALIATRNRPAALRRCIESLKKQGCRIDEILVFDDASDVPPPKEYLRKASDVSLIRSDERLGVAAARNRLMAEADSDILCLLDDDCVLPEGTLPRILQTLSDRPDVGALAGRIIDHRGGREKIQAPFNTRALKHDPSLVNNVGYASYFIGGLHAVRREAFEATGGYEDKLFWGGEEMDLSYRIIDEGYSILYDPEALAHHRPPDEKPDERSVSRELYLWTRNRFLLAYMHLPARFVPSYLAIWLGHLARRAWDEGHLGAYRSGLRDGMRTRAEVTRSPVGPKAREYLHANHGRLWY